MGNCRFKLSDIFPNAWLYKLKDMSTKSKTQTSSKPPPPPPPPPLKDSHYFTSDPISKDRFFNPPIISPRTSCAHFPHPQKKFKKRSKKKITQKISSPKLVSSSVSSACRVIPLTKDIVVDSERKSRFDLDDELDPISHLNLAPIFTKPRKFEDAILDFNKRDKKTAHVSNGYPLSVKPTKEVKGPAKKSTSSCSQGLRVCANSPRLANKKIQAYNRRSPSVTRRKSLSESFAVVKSSFDPKRDFRDSMVEMIVANNIRASQDLEDLLASYLSLNSTEFHDVIVKVFEQIWFDLTDI